MLEPVSLVSQTNWDATRGPTGCNAGAGDAHNNRLASGLAEARQKQAAGDLPRNAESTNITMLMLPLQTKGPWWKEYENQQLLATAFLDWPWAVRGFGSGPSIGYTKAVRGSRSRSDSPPNRRQWNTAEDARLEQLITLHGVGQWTTISSFIPGRSNKQCRERWRNHLDPAICRSPWAADEDALVVKLQADQGNRWSEISQRLPGRTAHAVRSRWHFHLKPKQARTPRLLQRRRVKVWSDCSPERQKDAGFRAIDSVCERVLADAVLADAVIQSLTEEDDG